MLRSVALPVFALVTVVVGAIQCGPDWAVSPNQSPRAEPAIPSGQGAPTVALLIDALLAREDMPVDVNPGLFEQAALEPDAYLDFIAKNGWAVRATWWKSADESVVFALNDYRYAFADPASARLYMDAHTHADPLRTSAPAIADFAPDTYAYMETTTVTGLPNPERRLIQIRSVADRVMISLALVFDADDETWQARSVALLETAQARTHEALTAAGE